MLLSNILWIRRYSRAGSRSTAFSPLSILRYGTLSPVFNYCSSCGRQFDERTGTQFRKPQFPTDAVLLADLWRLRVGRRVRSESHPGLPTHLGHTGAQTMPPHSDSWWSLLLANRVSHSLLVCLKRPHQFDHVPPASASLPAHLLLISNCALTGSARRRRACFQQQLSRPVSSYE